MKRIIFIAILISITLLGCAVVERGESTMVKKEGLENATFAGGCFWCMEAAFQALDGVTDVVSGYTGGETDNPTYEEVSSGKTGHYEAILITFDPEKISYKELVEFFWRNIDPTDDKGQFVDKGSQYLTAIFYVDDEQKKIAEESKKELEESGKFDKPVVTKILKAPKFFLAEEYHQDYSEKRTIQYKLYEVGSGRPQYIKKTWGEDN